MPDDTALQTLKEQHSRLKDVWQTFHDTRASQWDPVIRRQAPQTDIVDLLARYAPGVDIQSAKAERALSDWLAAKLLELTKIDVYSLDNRETAKRAVEDIRIVHAGSWGQQNDKKQISRPVFNAMDRYGLACVFKTWHMPEEPDLEGVEGSDAEKKRDKYWDDYYADDKNCPFGHEHISMLEVSVDDPSDPYLVIQESKIKYTRARGMKRDEKLGGGVLGLKDLKKVAFIGPNEPPEEFNTGNNDTSGTEIHFMRRAMCVDDKWTVDTWVRVADTDISESEHMEHYDVPFDRCPYFFIASDSEQATESDPHLRYRPKIYGLLVLLVEWNALVTQLDAAIQFRLEHPFYVRYDGLDGPALMALTDSAQVEGQGAERKLVVRFPETGSDEIPTAPALEALPTTDIAAIIERLKMLQGEILEEMPNRFLLGRATERDLSGTGTGLLNQAQAAQTTVRGDLDNFDAFVEEWMRAEEQAWCYWDEGSEVLKPRKHYITGDEPVVANPRERGEEAYYDADKLKYRHVIHAYTANMTQQERALEDQSADLAFQNGSLTKTQWLKKRGADDPEKQADDLWKDQMERMTEELMMPVYVDQQRRFISAFTDTAPPPPPMQEGQQGGKPAGNGQRINTQNPKVGVHDGTAPAVGGAPGSSNGMVPQGMA